MRFLFIVLLAFTLVRLGTSCDSNNQANQAESFEDEQESDKLARGRLVAQSGNVADVEPDWQSLGRNLKPQEYSQVKSKQVQARGNGRITLFTVPATLVFTPDASEVSLRAKDELAQIARVVKGHFAQGRVYVYAPAPTTPAGQSSNQDRATEVKSWLVVQEGLDEARVFALGGQEAPLHAPDLPEAATTDSVQIIAIQP